MTRTAYREPLVLDQVTDLGPVVTDAKGNPVGAARVVTEFRPDPSITERKQLVRGARRANALSDLYARGVISKRQHDAAARLLDDCGLACGGGLVANLLATPGGGTPGGATDAQMDALGRVRVVFQRLRIQRKTVTWWVLFEDGRLDAWDARYRIRKGTASTMFKEALTALDEFYHGK